MPVRLRKLAGAIALIALVLSWVLIAIVLAQFPVLHSNAVLEAGYYALAGLGWILPAMPLHQVGVWETDDAGRAAEDGRDKRRVTPQRDPSLTCRLCCILTRRLPAEIRSKPRSPRPRAGLARSASAGARR